MSKNIHIISHSHWDREWYLPFEEHRMRLIELIERCMELFETDKSFKSFHLDGQTIVLDDYLEVKPENRDRLIKYIKEGKFIIGPWYVLQDEFLTSGESNVRNLLIGMKSAKQYGGICRMGYFPDAFGNAGQMPQLLSQAGIDAVAFGRGVRPTGFNNEVAENSEYESSYSEMIWQSPDGTGIIGILFANWYNNGNEIPADPEKAKAYWDEKIRSAAHFASTDEYLLMNGCDHQPVQADISKAIQTASGLYPDMNCIHSDFPGYIKALKEKLPKELSVVKGELTSQNTDGWSTLVNTASSRIYLKQMNRKCESALENIAEPIRVMSSAFGQQYPSDEMDYAWKVLMQNHTHDGICGCSVDAVHSEMVTRFDKSMQAAQYLIGEGKEYIADRIDTRVFQKYSDNIIPFAVFNTTGRSRGRVISAELDIVRAYGSLRDNAHEIDKVVTDGYILIDTGGNSIPFKQEDMGVHFGYDLPKDKFRQPYMSRRVRITFEAESVPAMGYKTYALVKGSAGNDTGSLVTGKNRIENEFLTLEIQSDGSLDIYDKASGRKYEGLCYYEETGDIGNEYMYKMPEGTKPIITKGQEAKTELIEDEPFRAVYKITHTMTVPKSGDEVFEDEKRHMVFFKERKGGRSRETVEIVIETYVSLEKHGRGVKIKTVFENKARDHRVRIMIPTGIEAREHHADSVFDLVTRNNARSDCWTNPCGCDRQQAFVSIDDGKSGIAAANIGLYEYEILPDMDNTIAVTLLRAVGEMGDWGVFPTPQAQCIGASETEIELIPYSKDIISSGVYENCYQLRVDMPYVPIHKNEGCMPCEYSMLDWSGEGLTLTGMKVKEDAEDIIIRWVNLSGKTSVLSVKKTEIINNIYRSNVIEQNLYGVAEAEDGYFNIDVKPHEIITLGVKRGE